MALQSTFLADGMEIKLYRATTDNINIFRIFLIFLECLSKAISWFVHENQALDSTVKSQPQSCHDTRSVHVSRVKYQKSSNKYTSYPTPISAKTLALEQRTSQSPTNNGSLRIRAPPITKSCFNKNRTRVTRFKLGSLSNGNGVKLSVW